MNKDHEQLLEMVDRMPAFSSSVTRILQLSSDINFSPKELVEAIDHDPVMTIKILKLVNSAYFSLSKEITSIKQSVVFLGINTIKNLAITIAAMGMLPEKNSQYFDSSDFLLHSLGTATVARLLSLQLGVSSKVSSDYFVAGLLHDFGKVVLMQYRHEEMERALALSRCDSISLHEAEMIVMGTDHTVIGGLLGEKWQLPHELVLCLREHHNPLSGMDVAKMRDCVIAANLIIKHLEFGHAGNAVVELMHNDVSTRFGKDLEGLIESLGDIAGALDKTRVFASL